jgi:hypothetical protein
MRTAAQNRGHLLDHFPLNALCCEDNAGGEIILDELGHILIQLMCVPAADPTLPGS